MSNQQNKLIQSNTEYITSREIAELTGKRHDDILRAIRKMEVAWLKLGERKFTETYYIDKSNRKKYL